jgi:hypothetical protein
MNPTFAKAKYEPRDEPDWSSKSAIVRIASQLAFSNLPSIQRGFSYPLTVSRNMVTLRNFYAHRSQMTAAKVEWLSKELRIAKTRRATEVLNSLMPRRRNSVFVSDGLKIPTFDGLRIPSP